MTASAARAELLGTLEWLGWPEVWDGPFQGWIRGEAAWRAAIAAHSEEENAAVLTLLRGHP